MLMFVAVMIFALVRVSERVYRAMNYPLHLSELILVGSPSVDRFRLLTHLHAEHLPARLPSFR